jgi:hypothetical protein
MAYAGAKKFQYQQLQYCPQRNVASISKEKMFNSTVSKYDPRTGRTIRLQNCVGPQTPLETMRSIFASTGLSDSQITTMYNYLGPNSAVVFGSAPMYAYKRTTNLNGVQIGDIDILCESDGVAHGQIRNFLLSCGFRPANEIVDSSYDLTFFSGKDWNMVSSSKYRGELKNPVVFDAASPNNTTTIPFANSTFGESKLDYGNTEQYQKNNGTIIQLLLKFTPSESNLVNFLTAEADMTVTAGTFDGKVINTPYPKDLDTMKTTYRDAFIGDRVRSWPVYRLKKFIDRGFFIYFANQAQVNAWNNTITNLYGSAAYWYTSVQNDEVREALAIAGYCPFPLRV